MPVSLDGQKKPCSDIIIDHGKKPIENSMMNVYSPFSKGCLMVKKEEKLWTIKVTLIRKMMANKAHKILESKSWHLLVDEKDEYEPVD